MPPRAGSAPLGITADQVTLAGFALGMLAAVLVASGRTALSPSFRCLANRALDGVDGARWRGSPRPPSAAPSSTSRSTSCSTPPFRWPSASPAPEQNALAAAVLLAAFVVTGTSFLAFAVLAEKRGLKSTS